MDARSAFIFRADGNAGLGHGHLVRCLTLAAELERQGGRILFVAREFGGALRDKLDWRSYELHCSLCSDIGGGRAIAWRDDPTLNPKFVEMARYAKSRGIKEVSPLTNLLKLTPAMFEELVEIQMDWLTISFDGLGDAYNEIRAPAKFDEAIAKIREFSEIKKRKRSLTTQSLV